MSLFVFSLTEMEEKVNIQLKWMGLNFEVKAKHCANNTINVLSIKIMKRLRYYIQLGMNTFVS